VSRRDERHNGERNVMAARLNPTRSTRGSRLSANRPTGDPARCRCGRHVTDPGVRFAEVVVGIVNAASVVISVSLTARRADHDRSGLAAGAVTAAEAVAELADDGDRGPVCPAQVS
jgi:hypothetical protein